MAKSQKPVPSNKKRDAAVEDEDTKKPKGTAVAKAGGANKPSAAVAALAKEGPGRGVSKKIEDNLVPLVYVLQPMSPQVLKKNPDYIEGAEAGMLWLRNDNDPLMPSIADDDEEGILVQPCYFNACVIEWIPRKAGGGFVRRHDAMPANAIKKADPDNPRRISYVTPEGNELRESREHVVRIFRGDERLGYVIPFASTNLSVSKGWMTMMNRKTKEDGDSFDSWFGLYRIQTKYRSNSDGDWYMLNVTDEGFVDSIEDIRAGEAMFKAFDTGAKKVADDEYKGMKEGDEGGDSTEEGDDQP